MTGNAIGQLKWIWFQEGKKRHLHDLQVFDDVSHGPLGIMICPSTRATSTGGPVQCDPLAKGHQSVMWLVMWSPFRGSKKPTEGLWTCHSQGI